MWLKIPLIAAVCLYAACTPAALLTGDPAGDSNRYFTLKISEVCSLNASLAYDRDGDTPDWIEIVYIGPGPANLKGVMLSDDRAKPDKFIFGDCTVEPGTCVIVFASGKKTEEPWEFHAPFKLGSTGCSIFLSSPDLYLIDQVYVPPLRPDQVFGLADGPGSGRAILAMATPGRENNSYPLAGGEKPAPPAASRPSGFYESGFSLELSAEEDCMIYYTLDCSEPDLASIEYTGPFGIDRSLTAENRPLSADNERTAVSQHLSYDLNPHDLAVVVRTRAIREGAPPSEISTRVYWIGSTIDAGRFPVVSLVTEAGNLLDRRRGIYVLGDVFDNYVKTNSLFSDQGNWPANYNRRGPAWEGPADFTLYEPSRHDTVDFPVRLKTHGVWSRDYAQKSLLLKFYGRGDDGTGLLYALFPDLTAQDNSGRGVDFFRTVILRNSGNDWYFSMFRDVLMNRLTAGLDLDIAAYRPVLLYLNGEFWGMLNLREYFDEAYFLEHYGIPMDKVVVIERGHPAEVKYGPAEEGPAYDSFMESLKYLDASREEDLAEISAVIDIDNYIDYIISQVYFGNSDWPGNNIRFWKALPFRAENKAPAADGLYRQLLFDLDFGLGLYSWTGRQAHNTINLLFAEDGPDWPNPEWSTRLFRALMQNPAVREKFLTRYCDLLNTVFSPAAVITETDRMTDIYREIIPLQHQRWPQSARRSLTSWLVEIELIKEFARLRRVSLDPYMMEAFDIAATCKLHISSDDTTFAVNGLDADGGDFNGHYFKDMTVAISLPGGDRPVLFRDMSTGVVLGRGRSLILKTDNDISIAITDADR